MNRDVCEHFNPVDLPCEKCNEKRKSEALFLADELTIPLGTVIGSEVHRRAAAELRRLHELAMDQQGKIYALEMARSMQQKTAKLRSDALLEALREIVAAADGTGWDQLDASFSKARAAIKQAEEKA